MTANIFVSSLPADRLRAEQLCRFLEHYGFPCSLGSSDAAPGPDGVPDSLAAIKNSAGVVLFWSGETLDPVSLNHFRREFFQAASNNIPVVVLRPGPVSPPQLIGIIGSRPTLQFSNPPTQDEIGALLQMLKTWAARFTPAATPAPLNQPDPAALSRTAAAPSQTASPFAPPVPAPSPQVDPWGTLPAGVPPYQDPNLTILRNRLSQYRDSTGLFQWTLALVVALICMGFFNLLSGLVLSNNKTDTISAFRYGVFSVGAFLLLVPTGVVALCWLYRMRENAAALGAEDLKYSSGMTVGSFFIPFANLIVPCQAIQEIYRANQPNGGPTDFHGWKQAKSSELITIWWVAYVIISIVGQAVLRSSLSDFGSNSTDTQITGLDLFSTCTDIVSHALFVLVLFTLQKAQDQKYLAAANATGTLRQPPQTVLKPRVAPGPVVAFSLLVLAQFAGFVVPAVLNLALGTPSWKPYNSPDGQYSIQFPAELSEDNQTHKTDDGTKFLLTEATLGVDEYAVVVCDLPNANILTDDEKLTVLRASAKGCADSMSAKSDQGPQQIQFDGHTGIEMSFHADGLTGKTRAFTAGDKVVEVFGIQKLSAQPEIMDKFLNSLDLKN